MDVSAGAIAVVDYGMGNLRSVWQALVHVADYMAYQMRLGAPGAYPPETCSAAALKVLGITEAQTLELQEAVRAELDTSLDILALVE